MLKSTNKNQQTKLLSYFMVMLLIANIFTPYSPSYATGMDKTALIQNALTVTLMQDGVATTEIDVSKPFELQGQFNFDINHESDDDPNKIKQGDTASIYITDGVKLSDEQLKPQTLLDEKSSGKSVATLTLRNEGDNKKVYADIVFDGEVFSLGYVEAGIVLKASLKLGKDPSSIPEAGETIKILEKTFTLKPPAVKFEYKFVKDGVRNGNIISWTVDVEVLKNKQPHPLRGYRFSDELKDVGEFVKGSFKVDGKPIADPSGTKLEYTFDTDSSTAKITFDTKIPDSIYYSQSITKTTLDPVKGIIVEAGDKTVTNEAKLSGSDGTELAKAAKAISFKPIWIAKAGEGEKGSSGIYDPKNHTISWTITANQEEARLKDAYILDKLSETSGTANAGGQNLGPLTLDKTSVTLQIWDKVQGKWGAPQALTETSSGPRIEGERFYLTGPGEYTQQAQYMLKFTTKVPTPPQNFVASTVNYSNSASLHWYNGPGIGTNVTATVGFNAINKWVANIDNAKGIVTWDAKVEAKQQNIPDLAVYEIFSYSNAGLTNVDESKLPSGLPVGLIGSGNLTKGQQYIKDSFNKLTSSGLSLSDEGKIYNKDGDEIGQWIKIIGFEKDKPATYRLQTIVVAPELLSRNSARDVSNKALLYSSSTKINESSAKASLWLRIGYKELLHRDVVSDPIPNVHNRTEDISLGFNYSEKAVVYRLSLNPDGIDLANRKYFDGKNFKTCGEVVYEDVLPLGWEFVPIDGDKHYVFFDGEPSGSLRTTAKNKLDTAPISPVFELGTDVSSARVTFKFSNLDKPYVVLLKAKPTAAKMKDYFEKNIDISDIINTLMFKISGDSTTSPLKNQKVRIVNTVLGKDLDLSKVLDGILIWTVEYKPSELEQKALELKDTLPIGIDLPTDSEGKISLTDEWADAVVITKLALQKDGSYTGKENVPVKTEGTDANVHYDHEKRELVFKIPAGKDAYRFTYKTKITGQPGEVKNKVELSKSNLDVKPSEKSYMIAELSAGAFAKLGGYVNITKVDGTAPLIKLPNAEFELFNSKGKVFRTGVTDPSGTLKFIGLPAGTYTLKEKKAPAGYKTDRDLTYTITVEKGTGDYTTKIVDKAGNAVVGNDITVKNFAENSGELIVTKEIKGSAKGNQKEFSYTVTFDKGVQYPLYKYDAKGASQPETFIVNKGTVKLKDGEKFIIGSLPPGTNVTVTETPGDYTVSVTPIQNKIAEKASKDPKQALTIVKGENQLDYVNTYTKGGVKVSKKVTGSAADPNKEFAFTVHFSKGAEYSYTGENGLANGKIKNGGIIRLKHGQAFTINDIPEKVKVGITENPDGYTILSPSANGEHTFNVVAGEIQQIEYLNQKNSSGGGRPPSGGGNPPSTPGTTPPTETTISDNTTPLGSDPTKPKQPTEISDSTIIHDDSVPKQGIEKSQKISGAPKTGFSDMNIMFKNFLFYGTILLLLMALADEYSPTRRRYS